VHCIDVVYLEDLKVMVGKRRKISFKSDDKRLKRDSAPTITLSADQYNTAGGP
jgi:hypothetical protein